MDPAKIIKVLEGTMNPEHSKEAEANLQQMHKIAGFAPLLLRIVMSDEVAMPVRQSGAIFLKNTVSKSWADNFDENGCPLSDQFSIHENDRAVLRSTIIKDVVIAPDSVRSQLTVVVHHIIKNDYPNKWPDVVQQINEQLQTNPQAWMGALLVLYQLVKNYEYKKAEERGPIMEPMKVFLPIMLEMFNKLIPDNSSQSALLQKQLVKILYAFIQYILPLQLFDENMIEQYIAVMKMLLQHPVPAETQQVDESEREELPWWKLKKWAMRLVARIFERYGSPGSVTKEYDEFSKFFLKRYSVGLLEIILKFLDQYRNQVYVAPRVLQLGFQYLEQAINHAHTWKMVSQVYMDVLKDVVFPLMCFTEEDQSCWEDDPQEYIRKKFSIFEDFLSPSNAANCFLNCACSKRKNVLAKTMNFCHTILTETSSATDQDERSRKKDGVLHVIGALSDSLMKRRVYREQLEAMLKAHVLPELDNPYGYMRARACWVLETFAETKVRSKETIIYIADKLKMLLIQDKELPVRVEAASALSSFLSSQPIAEKHCVTSVQHIVQALLELVRMTENDELTNVVQRIICLYSEEVAPYAVEITENLCSTFMSILEGLKSDDGLMGDFDLNEDKGSMAIGVLTAIETVLEMMEEESDITQKLESIVAPIILEVLKNRVIDYYDEIFQIIYSLTCQKISPDMWSVLGLIFEVFQDDGFDFFVEMMPTLHNYCTIDNEQLLADPKRLEVIFMMCKKVFEADPGEDPEAHAAKLLEVIILQCNGLVDAVIPHFVEVVLHRLCRPIKTNELRTICLQVVIAALFYNPVLLFQVLENMPVAENPFSVGEQFFKQWFTDIENFQGIHDRKMCIIGFCTLMKLEKRPQVVEDFTAQIIPSLIKVFQGLIRAYKVKGEEEASVSDDDENGNGDDDSLVEKAELASDEDEIDEDSAEYLEMLDKSSHRKGGDYTNGSIHSDEETELEFYATKLDPDGRHFNKEDLIDEFILFRKTINALETSNPAWYQALTGVLNEEQRTDLKNIYVFADQRKAVQESKKIENAGGYSFNDNVPAAFNFSSQAPPSFSP